MTGSESLRAFRVLWGLGRSEDFALAEDAAARADEIYAEMVETWPMLAGSNDAILPRVREIEAA